MVAQWTTLTVDGSPMKAYVALPPGNGPFPAVAVAQHASGVDGFIQNVCDRLAEAGYAAAAPDLYHRQEQDITFEEIISLKRGDPKREATVPVLMGKLLDEEMVRDMNATLDHLSGLPGVNRSATGVTGFCMGGRVAYLMATRNARLKAAACFYPGSVFKSLGGGPSPFAASDRIMCAMQGFFGKDDANPSPEDMERMTKELTRLRVDHEFHAYDGAAHAFMDHTNAKSYREGTAADAWSKLLSFFSERLKVVAGAGR